MNCCQAASTAARSTPPGRYLGFFEFKPDGTLTFNTTAPLPAQPSITSVVRNGDVTTVSFTTVSGLTYRLRHTDTAGLTATARGQLGHRGLDHG